MPDIAVRSAVSFGASKQLHVSRQRLTLRGASQVEWGTGEPQPELVKPPPQPKAEKDRFAQFAASREEAASLRSMVGNCRQPGGGFYTGACTHY